MKTFMYMENGNYIQKKCKKVEDFNVQYQELRDDILSDRYVPRRDFLLLFDRMNQSDMLDFSRIHDYLKYQVLDIVAATSYVGRYLDLYRFSKEQTVITPAEMDERLYCARNNTFGTQEARRAYQEYASAMPNTQVMNMVGYTRPAKKDEQSIQHQIH